MRIAVTSLFSLILLSCGSSGSSSSSTRYVNPHAQAHSQMHQELQQEEMQKELTRKLENLAGTYTGTLPCADCDGISFELTLNPDLSYVSRTSYLGKSEEPVVKEGTFSIGEGWKIQLDQNTGDLQNFQPDGENLKVLSLNGLENKGEWAEKYILKPSGK